MCKGARPIGAAKGKQTNTMALCQSPPPPLQPLSAMPVLGLVERALPQRAVQRSSSCRLAIDTAEGDGGWQGKSALHSHCHC